MTSFACIGFFAKVDVSNLSLTLSLSLSPILTSTFPTFTPPPIVQKSHEVSILSVLSWILITLLATYQPPHLLKSKFITTTSY